jgi:16S rRNA processing protein RimM
VERVRFHQRLVILKLAGCDSRDQAENLRGQWLQVPIEEAIPLAEGEYFYYQLIGLQVETAGGELLGKLAEILETGANNVFIIRNSRHRTGDLLLPDIPGVVLDIDLKAGRMVVKLPPGLRDE